MSDESAKEIIPGSWRRIIRDEVWENESPKINACWTPIGELQQLERELAVATRQRDALADSLRLIWNHLKGERIRHDYITGTKEAGDLKTLQQVCVETLAAMEGGAQ